MKNFPELRFKGFNKQWSTAYLNEVSTRVTRKNKNLESHIPLTISAEKGLVDQLDYYNNRVASKDISGYYLIQNGEFAYNKSTSRDAPYGAIKRLDFYKNGVLSTLYIVFRITNGDLDSFKYYFESIYWHREIYKISQEGARNHGLLNISVNDFFDIKIKIPNLEEQEKIGNLFRKIDDLIEIQEGKVAKMRDYKKSMLQKMFPKKDELVPEFRFYGFDSNWLISRLGEVTSLRGGYAFKSQDYIENGIPILRISNINSNGTTNEDYVYYTEILNDDNISLDNGAIVLAMSGATTGKISILKTQGKVYQNQRVGYFTKSDRIDYLYLSVILRSHLFTSQLDKILIAGAQPNISSKDVEDFSFKLPSLEEQEKIGNFFKKLDSKIEAEEKLLDSYKMMKKSLLQNMFV